MSANAEQRFLEKSKRLEAAYTLQEGDRVPFAPLTGYYPAGAYGISYYDLMTDPRNVIPGIRKYIEDFDPDLALPPVGYCIPACETTGATFVRWPGPEFGIPNDASFQVLDTTYLHDDEYGAFLEDPTHFLQTVILPRRFSKLAGFASFDFRSPTEFGAFDACAKLAQPEVKASLLAAIQAGEQIIRNNERTGQVYGAIVEAGVPLYFDGIAIAPYDIFSDDYRGLINTVMDIVERPDELEEALQYTTRVGIEKALADAKAAHSTRVFIPLHAGVDEFMSPANYERFYWSGLKKLILALIDEGMTPVVFCEGNYDTRLEVIADVPKGKVQYMFERCDLAALKKTIGDVSCFYGNFPNALLISGSKQQVIDHTKKMLDICAPGGGFIMNCGIALDNAKPENMEAWRETVEVYGKY